MFVDQLTCHKDVISLCETCEEGFYFLFLTILEFIITRRSIFCIFKLFNILPLEEEHSTNKLKN